MPGDRQVQRQLIRAILTEPDEPAPRQVYADWLEERGDPLGDLARIQAERSGGLLRRAHREELDRRQRDLLAGLGLSSCSVASATLARPPWDGEGKPPGHDWNY